jgi:uncharacterized damage-inducible protein DinB
MDMLQPLNRLFVYDAWANREALGSLKNAGTPPPRALKFMAHIIAAEWLWFYRLQMNQAKLQSLPVWPDLTLGQCETQIANLAQPWRDYLAGLTSPKLSTPISYTNTKGESFTNTVEDILQHVIMHSAYHRGQIATDLRSAGFTPAYTDFIHAVRQKFVDKKS